MISEVTLYCRSCSRAFNVRSCRALTAKYCSRDCLHQYRRTSFLDRFDKFVVFDASGCWLWTGTISKTNGYGHTEFSGKTVLVHRESYETFVGPIPEGVKVLHTCDVRHCLNPEHLFTGSSLDNSQDMVSKGRSMSGIKNSASKLTEKDVLLIRQRYKNGESGMEIAKSVSVHWGTVYAIISRKIWRHI